MKLMCYENQVFVLALYGRNLFVAFALGNKSMPALN